MLSLRSRYLRKVRLKRRFIKTSLVLLIMTLLVGVSFASGLISLAMGESGKCGENLSWSMVPVDVGKGGTWLYITGNGDMYDYSNASEVPWMQYKNNIDGLQLSTEMTSIGDYAFVNFDKQHVLSIPVPDGVTRIGKHSLENVTSELSMPDSVVEIDSYAFAASSFNSSKLPAGLQFIGDYAFQGTGISSLTMPSGVTHIGEYAFGNCDSLDEIYFNYTVDQVNSLDSNSISSTSFGDNSNLKLIFNDNYAKTAFDTKFPDLSSKTVSQLKITGLKDTYSLGSTEIIQVQSNRPGEVINYTIDNNNVASINNDGIITILSSGNFSVVAKVEGSDKPYDKANFGPITVTSPGKCGDYLNFTLSSDNTVLTIFGNGDMYNYSYDDYHTEPNPPLWAEYKDTITKIEINAQNGDINNIGSYAFSEFSKLNEVNMGGTIKRIGNNAFENCTSLASIENSNSVTMIDNSAFYMCKSLSQISIPSSVISIGDFAFEGCTSFTNIELPSSVKTIGKYAFYECEGLSTISIPTSVTSIGNAAFAHCYSLTSIELPSSITIIGNSTFEKCTNLSQISIPTSVTSIGNSAFENCTSLANIELPTSITAIGNSAFKGCTVLSGISVPNSVTSIGDNAFENCTSLVNIELPNSITTIGNSSFKECTVLSRVSIPSSITSIGDNAFENCTSLLNIEIPNSTATIGNSAFKGCTGLSKVSIPSSATLIGDSAFVNCTSLKVLILEHSADDIANLNIGSLAIEANTKIIVLNLDAQNAFNTKFQGLYSSICQMQISGINGVYATKVISNEELKSYVLGGDLSLNIYFKTDAPEIARFDDENNLVIYHIGKFNLTAYRSENKESTPEFYNTASIEITTETGKVTDLAQELQDITNIENGSEKSVEGLKLPTEMQVVINNESVSTMPINWDLDNCTYDPSLSSKQTFKVEGVIAENSDIKNPDKVSVSVNVTVNELDPGPNPPPDPDPDPGPDPPPDPIISSGKCGDYLNYNLYSGNFVLNIYGSGDMYDYSYSDDSNVSNLPPWEKYKRDITKVEFNSQNGDISRIGDFAFSGFSKLNEVNMPETIRTIGDFAFEDCTSLANIELSNSVITIGNSTFKGCTSLSTISVPNSVTSIGDSTFESCTSLANIELSTSLATIGNSAFKGCTSLSTISVPSSVTSIGDSTFEDCTSLTNIELSTSLVTIGNSAFKGCTSLSTISVPNSVTSIGDYTFEGCTSLTNIEFPTSLVTIGNSAFKGCTSLSTISVPNSVTSIGDSTFEGCASLANIELPNSITTIENGIFKGCTALRGISIPVSVTSIGDSTFENCTSLSNIELPKSITAVGNSTFRRCTSLSTISIPSSVRSIGDFAFGDCASLDFLTLEHNAYNIANLNIGNLAIDENTKIMVVNPDVQNTFNSKFQGLYSSVCQMQISGISEVHAAEVISSEKLKSYALGGDLSLNIYFKIDTSEIAEFNDENNLVIYHIGKFNLTAYRAENEESIPESYNTASIELTVEPGEITALAQELQDITNIANGAEKSVEGLNLPTEIQVVINNEFVSPMPINWNLEGCVYDPSLSSKQTFKVEGIIAESNDIKNPDKISATVNVTVNGIDPGPTPPPDPSPGPDPGPGPDPSPNPEPYPIPSPAPQSNTNSTSDTSITYRSYLSAASTSGSISQLNPNSTKDSDSDSQTDMDSESDLNTSSSYDSNLSYDEKDSKNESSNREDNVSTDSQNTGTQPQMLLSIISVTYLVIGSFLLALRGKRLKK